MAVDLSSMPPEDREDFQRRLQTYGLDLSAVQEPLSVTPAAKVTLAYGPGRASARMPHVLETTDLAAVKRMIGVDDRVFRNVAAKVAMPRGISLGARSLAGRSGLAREKAPFEAGPGMSKDEAARAAAVSDEHLREMDEGDLSNIRAAARAYVRGDSRMVSSYEPLFAKAIGRITLPIWVLQTITVASGATLEFGPGVNCLVAYQVIVEPGGKIVSRGHLTVNCTQFRRPGRFRIRPVGDLTAPFKPIFN
jgi:hypothetical protein